MQQQRVQCYAPAQVEIKSEKISIINEMEFIGLPHLKWK